MGFISSEKFMKEIGCMGVRQAQFNLKKFYQGLDIKYLL
jgi:hypothetical protein